MRFGSAFNGESKNGEALWGGADHPDTRGGGEERAEDRRRLPAASDHLTDVLLVEEEVPWNGVG